MTEEPYQNMFPYQPQPGEHALIVMAGFHLGIPLAVCQTRRSTGWLELSKEISQSFANHSERFKLVSVDDDPVTRPPSGKPLTIRYLGFFELFNLLQYLEDAGISLSTGCYSLDHLIWICPTGVVLIIVVVSFPSNQPVTLDVSEQDKVVTNHYAELTYVFTEIASIIFDLLPPTLLRSAICSRRDIDAIRRAIDVCRILGGSNGRDLSRVVQGLRSLAQSNPDTYVALESILLDAYYIDFLASNSGTKPRASYVDSSIESLDPEYLLVMSIAYTSFVGLLWLQKHLGEQSQILEKSLIGASAARGDISTELKLLRIFSLQFISESHPINIRLTHQYMEYLEEYWRESRLDLLVSQVNDQLETLETMFDWIEDFKREDRNLKIGLAALLFGLISIASVVAQLISTLDVSSELGTKERILWILLGFTIGMFLALGIILFPASKLRLSRRR